MNAPAAALEKFLGSSWRCPQAKCWRVRTRQYFKLLKKHTPVLFVLLVLLVLLVFLYMCIPPKALHSRFDSKTMPHPSFFASTNIGYISNSVFNLVQSTWKFPLKRCKTPKNCILLVEKMLVLFSIALVKFIYSFIHLLWTLNKVSRSHILLRNTLHCAL